MSDNTKFRWFLIPLLLSILFCSNCAWIKSYGQWSEKKRVIKSEILENPNSYDVNYDLGIAFINRGKKFSFPSTNWKKVLFQSAIVYLEEAIRIRPESAEAHLALGEVLGDKKINDGFGAIKHTLIAEKLFQRQNHAEGIATAKENRKFFSDRYFSFYLLDFSNFERPESLSVPSSVVPFTNNVPSF